MVGEHHVLVAQTLSGAGHDVDRRTTVGPVGVGVQVAEQLRADLLTARRQRTLAAGSQLGEVVRHVAVERLPDDLGTRLADVVRSR